jgi:arylformamidase
MSADTTRRGGGGHRPAAAAGRAPSRPPPHEKGPLVFLDYDQVELDAAYDQQVYQPNIVQVGKRWTSNSARTRLRLGEPIRVSYGPTEIERLDIFRTARERAPVFVFIHGGAWARGKAADYHAPAEMFVRAGAHYITPDFAWVQDVGGSLFPMTDQICRAIAWVYQNAASFGGDRDRIYVGGQSSGAHLTAVALTTDWAGRFGLPADPVKGGLCASGMYELAPVRLSARANYVKFTDAMVEELSPIRHLDRLRAPLIVSYGTYETPEFQRQAGSSPRRCSQPVSRSTSSGDNYSHTELLKTYVQPTTASSAPPCSSRWAPRALPDRNLGLSYGTKNHVSIDTPRSCPSPCPPRFFQSISRLCSVGRALSLSGGAEARAIFQRVTSSRNLSARTTIGRRRSR